MCDTACVRRPGGVLFAKSSDRPIDEAQVVRWVGRRRPHDEPVPATHIAVPDAGAAALLGSQPTWMWGLEHGVNEHGVAIGNEKVWTVDDPRAVPPALLGMDLVRLGLERGTTADGALDAMAALLEAHGQGGSTRSGLGVSTVTASARQYEDVAVPSVTTARTLSPGRACRTKTTRPSCRATQWPPCATGPTSTSSSLPTGPLRTARLPAAARPGGRLRERCPPRGRPARPSWRAARARW